MRLFDKLRVVAVSLLFMTPTALPSQSLSSIVGDEFAGQLSGQSTLRSVQTRPFSIALMPQALRDNDLVRGMISEATTAFIETLYVIPKTMEHRNKALSPAEMAAAYSAACAISTLENIEYYSVSRKRMRVFYTRSRITDGKDWKQFLYDPVFTLIPERMELFALQTDTTFGENRYRLDFLPSMHGFIFRQTNVSKISLGPIPIIEPNGSRTVAALLDSDEYIVVYLGSAADAHMIPGLSARVRESFSNRADAVLMWFVEKINSTILGQAATISGR